MNKFKFQSSARGVESLLCLLRVSVFGAATWHLGFSVRVHKKDTFGTNRTFFFFFFDSRVFFFFRIVHLPVRVPQLYMEHREIGG